MPQKRNELPVTTIPQRDTVHVTVDTIAYVGIAGFLSMTFITLLVVVL